MTGRIEATFPNGSGIIRAADRSDDRKYYFHHASLSATLPFSNMLRGKQVKFEPGHDSDGPRALKIRPAI